MLPSPPLPISSHRLSSHLVLSRFVSFGLDGTAQSCLFLHVTNGARQTKRVFVFVFLFPLWATNYCSSHLACLPVSAARDGGKTSRERSRLHVGPDTVLSCNTRPPSCPFLIRPAVCCVCIANTPDGAQWTTIIIYNAFYSLICFKLETGRGENNMTLLRRFIEKAVGWAANNNKRL